MHLELLLPNNTYYRFSRGLVVRLTRFGLAIHPDKTKLVSFGRFALKKYAEKPSRCKLGTFDFLGFTHYIGRKLNGEVTVIRKARRKRKVGQLKYIKQQLRRRLHCKTSETGRWLKRMVQGHINYYGVPLNSRALGQFVDEVKRLWLKSLGRRSQRHSMDWDKFNVLIKRWIPPPRIVHLYPEQRFYAKYPK